MDAYTDTDTANADNRRGHGERVQVGMYFNAAVNVGIDTMIEVTRGDLIKQFGEASPVGQKNLPSGKVSGWPSDHLWLRVDATNFGAHPNWTSTEDPFLMLGDLEHFVLDSTGDYTVGPATHADFPPNCPVIAACHLSSWANEKGVGGENGAFWRTRTIVLASMTWGKCSLPTKRGELRFPTISVQEY